MHPPQLFVKICGITTMEDLALCHTYHADFTGFIFAEKSPRSITPATAATLILPQTLAFPPKRVGVFVQANQQTIETTMHTAKLDFIQLHGGESVGFCKSVGAQRVIKVLWPEQYTTIAALQKDIDSFAESCAYFLLDAGKQGGGSGKQLDWHTLNTLTFPKPWFLAGGLNAATVTTALIACQPDGVDLNSALESYPGKKDTTLLEQVFTTIPNRNNKG